VSTLDAHPGQSWVLRRVHCERLRYLLGLCVAAAAYYGAARVDYDLSFAGPVAAIVWFPVGVGIVSLYFGGIRLWPGVLVGDLLANDYTAIPLGSALGQTFGNMLEMAVAALLIGRLVSRRSPLGDVRDIGGLLVAITVGTAVSATVGPLSLLLGNVLDADALPTISRTWWLGDFTGALVVVPLALAWFRPTPRTFTHRRIVEAALMLATLVGLSEYALRGHSPLTYLLFPALIWAGLRFGQRGATLAIAIAVGLTMWNTAHYVGPFVFGSITRDVLNTQLFVAVAAISTLCLAAVVSEREKNAEGLKESRARLIASTDSERRRIERNLHDGAQQHLTSLAMHLGAAAERVREFPNEAESLFNQADTQLERAITELRELAHGIHTSVLTDSGLTIAMTSIARHSTVPVTFVELPPARFDAAVEAVAYYVFSEAVTNAQKHARASLIRVRVRVIDSNLQIDVSDNGIGGAAESGSGLQGLRDRVETVGGTFQVESVAGRGTTVHAAIPLPEPESLSR
jgi:signal transduction histidine kinase